jgi:hypothetical protein
MKTPIKQIKETDLTTSIIINYETMCLNTEGYIVKRDRLEILEAVEKLYQSILESI